VGEPERMGMILDLQAIRERLRVCARTPEEIAAWEADRATSRRQDVSHRVQLAIASVHDAAAVSGAGPIEPDAASREGIAWARQWLPSMPGAVVWGGVGSGKTTLLCRLLGRLGMPIPSRPAALGYSVCLCSVPRLLAELSGRQVRGGYGELLDAVGSVDVLVLDDIGVGSLRRGWAQHLWAVLDARWSGGRRPVLATSNIDPDTDPRLGMRWEQEDAQDVDRAVDRLRALAPGRVQYDSGSRRQG
jgi:hypothetical protein